MVRVATDGRGSAESKSFDAFFDEYFDRTRRLLEVIVGDAHIAEDAAQEAFARAFVRWDEVSAMNRPQGCVMKVGLNHARDVFRRERRAERRQADLVETPESHFDSENDFELIAELRALPLRQRQAVVLHYLADLPLEEVAAYMECALGTVKSTLHSALAKLRVNTEVMKP